MKVLITGGTGFIGGHLIRSLTQDQHEVAILTRSKKESKNRYLNYLQWDGVQMPLGIGLYDVVINLAGASIAGGRWTEAYKKEIRDSRINATRACVDYINRSPRPPEVFISASAVGYYGVNQTGLLDEAAPAGDDFAAEVGVIWEAEALKASCRTVIPRIGLVLGEDGGMMEKLLPIYQFYLGGKFASGKQGFPWIHIDDIVGGIRFLIDHAKAEGPFNFAAPELVTQAEFSKALAKAMNVADIWTIPKFALNLLFGEQSFLFWGGQQISSEKLRTAGYQFRFEELGPALQSIVD
ncbi:MAG: TIGR01777 family oxidoreductase [Bacteroidota bacterium]